MGDRRYSLRGYPAPAAIARTCSVWRPERGEYDYYAVSGVGAVGAAWPNPVGTPINEALPRLPLTARKTGSGPLARGTIVRGLSLPGLGDLAGFGATHLVVAALAVGAILYFTHRKGA